MQPVVNIGIVGHVDHGKTTLVKALSGVWTDRHSEEIKRGISIRLGYADIVLRKCPNCAVPEAYTSKEICEKCGAKTEVMRTISFVDSPGHETLMATMLSGAALMDGALLVIAANEQCPQPQTKEHLMALNIIGIENIVIIQNKIDIVPREKILENYKQIKAFVKGTVAENAPVIPVSAQQNANIDLVIEAIEKYIPTPERDLEKPPLMFVARSFDVNKPGTLPDKLQGGVIGGSLNCGRLRAGEELELRPGRKVEAGGAVKWVPIRTTVTKIIAGGEEVEEARPGGLIGVGTKLDPFLTKSDALVGQVAGIPGKIPPTIEGFVMEIKLLPRVVGVSDEYKVEPIRSNEPLMLNVGTATTIGVVTSARGNEAEVKLKRPVCAEKGAAIAISRRVGARWRLIGSGILKET
ncbi:MAG: translation initiation factor IF-2 subunit gamma [Candidatus Methanoperedens sp.]|nr:translation initiation factor IF-2 subunit gamma [Candidatus Methanoperedens sp.]MCZ7360291.1 translation initiation factor IF-2 subunit gamma [Candidatus Methanoperedens sp.]HLB69919.1 translation initiation factor IF-2 subunit gamma [Candidatus Methanoperedens sp.]